LRRLGDSGRRTIVKVATGRVSSNGGVGRVDVVLFVANGSLDPLHVLHVAHPDVMSGLTGPDGSRNESGDISKKDYLVEETERSDCLSGSTE